MVTVENLRKSFGPLEVLKGISLTVERGNVVALLGKSGSGKSTLLRCLNGLETFDSGSAEIAGHKVTTSPAALRELRKDVGIVFQSFNLFPHLTVERNITLGPTIVKGLDRAKAAVLAREALKRVGLEEKLHAYADQLSGGQQQRVAIARSLAMSPTIMLFDEFTSALDPELVGEVLRVLENMAREGMTMLLVTHEMNFARRVANRVLFMNQGTIWEQGPAAEFFQSPKTEELRNFLGSVLH
jgi:polar amino acid transport system ATP-binding protein